MIVDAHVSLDRDRFPVERALQILESANVRSAVVFADARAREHDEQNRYVLAAARSNGLYPFYYLGGNPYTDTRPEELYLPDDLEEYAGIRWHRYIAEGLDRQGLLDEAELEWAISLMESPEFEAVAAAAAHYNLPIIFEESFSVTLEFALRFPSLDIIVPHLGARSGGESNVMRALWDRTNVYFDTSLAQLDETVLSSVGADRILFGSGLPEGDPSTELDKIDRLPAPESAKEGIFGDNLVSLLSAYSALHGAPS
jgi:hypothetical protein